MFHRYCIRGALAALLFAPGVTGASGLAAQTGAVTGTVTDAGTGRPLAEASVSLADTETSGVTNVGGRYRLDDVPAGSCTLVAVIPGYRTRRKEVTVSAGDTRVVDFQLEVSNLQLDQIVRGGLAGPAERGRVGASSPALDAARVAGVHPVERFTQLLDGRIPGVRSVGTSGGAGADRDLVIRGIDSFGHTRQRPLVYIDGVRVDTDQLEWAPWVDVVCCRFHGGAARARLSDLNPEEIDRVEVLKGPAAATLYGVEGATGVIEVFTKHGRSNTPATFTLNTGLGFQRIRPNLPTTLRPNIGQLDQDGELVFPAWDPNRTLIENGRINSYDLTVSGGGEDVAYFVSGGLTYEEGSIKPNDQNRANIRANLRWTVAERNLTLGVTTAHARNRIRALQPGDSWLGVYTNAMLSDPRQATEDEPYGGGFGGSVADAQAIEALSDSERWTAGIQVEHAPRPNFTHRLTIGVDLVAEERTRHLPWGRQYTYHGAKGEKTLGHRRSRKATAGYRMAYGYTGLFGLAFLRGSLVAGAQLDRDSVGTSVAVVRGYRPGGHVGGVTTALADAGFSEQANLGVFVQNRFDLTRNLSLTTAVRFDKNSSFGFDPGWVSYPKAALAYNLPRSFLPAAISTLRVRAAAGKAGKPPPPSYRLPPWEPTVVLGDKPGMRITRVVDEVIRPEDKREVETGLDIGLLDDRIGVELTYYDARTAKAMHLLQVPSSKGAVGLIKHCCEIMNRGLEAALAASLVDLPSFHWKMNLAYEWNRNRITKLGPDAVDDSIPVYTQNEDGTWKLVGWDYGRSLSGLFEGQSVGDILSRGIAGHDPATNTHRVTDFRFNRGKARPVHMGSFFNSFRLGGSLRLSFQLRGELGAVMRNGGRTHGVRARAHDEYLRHLGRNGEPTYSADSVFDYHRIDAIDKRDHVRLQEVSLSYTVPERINGRLGLPGTTVTLSAYNLHWWDDCNCPDPSLGNLAGDLETLPSMALPQPRRFLLSVSTRF